MSWSPGRIFQWVLWLLFLVMLAVIYVDARRGSGFGPVEVTPCVGAACKPGARESWRTFSDAFSGRADPFAKADYCALSIEYLRDYQPEAQERKFVFDLMEGPFLRVTPTGTDAAVMVEAGPRATNFFSIISQVATFKPVGCHLSGWGYWPSILWFLTIGFTQWRQWQGAKRNA